MVGFALVLSGCSNLEPSTGTRVTYAFPGGKPIAREDLPALSHYLMVRAQTELGVTGARVDSVTDTSLVLLLPGKKASKTDVAKLTQRTSIELYHLARVATRRSPNRPWKLRAPAGNSESYLFTGPDAKRIDSREEPESVLKEVVGFPAAKPLLTGRDVSQNASYRPVSKGYAVLVKFSKNGTKVFEEFTRANRGEYLAVFYNGRLLSAPLVEAPISGGEAYITGFGGEDEARAAVAGLNAGDLPVNVKVESVEYY